MLSNKLFNLFDPQRICRVFSPCSQRSCESKPQKRKTPRTPRSSITRSFMRKAPCSRYNIYKLSTRRVWSDRTGDYSQHMKPNITPTSPTLMPVISLLPLPPLFLLALALGAVPVLVGLALPPVASTNQPPAVELGQAGGIRDGVYAELATPVGLRVFHAFCKLV